MATLPKNLGQKKSAYLCVSTVNSHHRIHIAKFIMESGYIPVYPEMVKDFYSVEDKNRMPLEEVKDSSMKSCDEFWVFGDVSRRMKEDINLALRLRKMVRYFDISGAPDYIKEISREQVVFEK
jgi:hypothetical protein